MITSEEAKLTIEQVYNCNNGMSDFDYKHLLDYITQQEKVNELLRLYQKHYKPRTYARPNTIDDYTRIDELESELND